MRSISTSRWEKNLLLGGIHGGFDFRWQRTEENLGVEGGDLFVCLLKKGREKIEEIYRKGQQTGLGLYSFK